MSNILNAPLSGGYVSTGVNGKSAYDLGPGELVQMKGAFYRKNDSSQPWRIPGRSLFGVAGSGAVHGVAICQFDAGGTDRILAAVSTKIVSAHPGSGGESFTDLITGLNPLATRLTACHQDDRWYLGNGYDQNKVLSPDGSVRDMSMQAPATAPTLATSAIANTTARPAATAGPMTQPGNSYDSDVTNFGNLHLDGDNASAEQSWSGWGADPTTTKIVSVKYALSVLTPMTLVIQYSTDLGVSWLDLYRQYYHGPITIGAPKTVETSISADSDQVKIRVQLVKSIWNFSTTTVADVRIYDVNVQYGSDANVTSTLGIAYATTEVIPSEGPSGGGGLESEPSPPSATLTFSSQSQVIVTRPPQINPAATHWRVYRWGEGVTQTKENLGRVSITDVLISSTEWADNLDTPITEQATPIISLVTVGDLSFYRDSPAPVFISMVSWKGSICGISRTNRRSWYYSEPGRPESFPAIYVVESFPLEEHDGLIGQMPVGETMVLLCQGAALAVDDTSTVQDGNFTQGVARPIKGHPGCVGEYAYATFSVAGEPRGAWVSPYGVYVTNGTICACVSTDLAWESEVNPSYLSNAVLRWDAKNLILWFQFDSDGDGLNDREMPFHMAQAHSKGESRPKLGQPTPKMTSCMASALLGTTNYRFSGHPSDGKVYVEEVGTVDAATGEAVATTIETAKISNNKVNMGILKATLIHSDFGLGETARLTTKLYRDASRSTGQRVSDLSVYGHRGTTVGVGRAGEAVQFKIEYSGSGSGAFLGIQAELDNQGRSGSAGRWVASSVTP